jgi:hypothetical protein
VAPNLITRSEGGSFLELLYYAGWQLLHELERLIGKGCPPETAVRIAA